MGKQKGDAHAAFAFAPVCMARGRGKAIICINPIFLGTALSFGCNFAFGTRAMNFFFGSFCPAFIGGLTHPK
jgi:hypothetical protein